MTAASAPESRGLVIVIEDETVIADVVRRYLSAAGFGVQVHGTGQDGLSAIRRDRPAAIVLDIGLPRADGFQVLHHLRNRLMLATPVLILTARGELDAKMRGFSMGADDYLQKPFALAEVAGVGKADAPRWIEGLALGIGGLAGAVVGARLQPRVPVPALKVLLAVAAIAAGIRTIP